MPWIPGLLMPRFGNEPMYFAPGSGAPVPAPAISRLTVIGGRAAKASGDTAPSWMTAVLTTRAKALTSATPGDFVPGAGDVPVFLVTMRGTFVATAASRPPGTDGQVRPGSVDWRQ